MCPVCNSKEVTDSHKVQVGPQLSECTKCGHAFQFSIDQGKGNREMQLEYFGDEFVERQGLFFDLYESINARRTLGGLSGRKHQRVLEIGPGSGRIMACLARLGHNVQGLDLSPAVAEHIAKRWGLGVHVESLDAHKRKLGAEYYDVIIMRHVLEHFPNPYEALNTAHSLLKPLGLLYVAVPNMQSWHSRFSGWSGYQPYHIHYFNPKSLSSALIRAGFRIVELHSYESLTGWPNTLFYSVYPRRSHQKSNGRDQTGQLKRTLLEGVRLAAGLVLWPFRSLQSFLGQGEELSVVAERVA